MVSSGLQAAAAICCAWLAASATAQGDWTYGRATWYDDSPFMSVHRGSCEYFQLDDHNFPNWHVVALSQNFPGISIQGRAPACGTCYEVRCHGSSFKDGFGQSLDRGSVCRSGASVIVKVTDSCPCHKPENAHSNQRWCCGDMYHMDLSVWAFELLAETKWGVIGIDFRQVDCSFKPAQLADSIVGPTITPTPRGGAPPVSYSSASASASASGNVSGTTASARASASSSTSSSSQSPPSAGGAAVTTYQQSPSPSPGSSPSPPYSPSPPNSGPSSSPSPQPGSPSPPSPTSNPASPPSPYPPSSSSPSSPYPPSSPPSPYPPSSASPYPPSSPPSPSAPYPSGGNGGSSSSSYASASASSSGGSSASAGASASSGGGQPVDQNQVKAYGSPSG